MQINKCRLCANNIFSFLDLGKQPLANSYIENIEEKLDTYPLELCYCENCGNLQLNEVVEPEIMFKHYLYVSSTPFLFHEHCKKLADKYSENLNVGDLIVDIASNDGCLLSKFDEKFIRLGVDPAENLAKIAWDKYKILNIIDFWSESKAREILLASGKAKLICAQNVFAHVNDLHDFVRGIKVLLDDDGKFIVEFPYAKEMFDRHIYDTIYHEHLSYFFITPLKKFFNKLGLYINDIEYFDKIHGGTIRLEVGKTEFETNKFKIQLFLDLEQKYFTDQAKFRFSQEALKNRTQFLDFIKKNKNLKIGLILLDPPQVDNAVFSTLFNENNKYICFDENPLKQKNYLPGTKIFIDSPANILDYNLDILIILTWNFQDEIIQRCKEKYNYQGLFMVCFPNFKIL